MKAYFESFIIAAGLIAISAVMCWMLVVQPIRKHLQVGQWDRIPVTITDVQMIESHDPRDNVTSYACQASYYYTVDGERYEATGVSIYSGSDNLSNFQQRIYQELSDYQKAAKPFLAYIKPEDPSEALLYRHIRWGVSLGVSLLTLLFGAAGVLLLVKTLKEIFST